MSDDALRLDRRAFLGGTLAATVASAAQTPRAKPPTKAGKGLNVAEADVEALQAAMTAGRASAVSLVRAFTDRIQSLDQAGPTLHAVLQLNPDALAIAKALDAERKTKGPRGPLHGIPVLLKDNIDTADRLETAAGSLALVGAPTPAKDAFLVARLREAGAVILGKTALSEWANYRSTRSSGGWNGRGGQCRNPHALDRNPSGSSSGSAVAVAAGFCPVSVGTETNGSIVSPANACGVVGLKPTLGLISRAGVVPLAHSQDTAGPMARSVRDAAILLGALVGIDPHDAATQAARDHLEVDYTRFLVPDRLKGARLGLLKGFLGLHPHVDPVLRKALEVLKAQGAEIVDVELPMPAAADRELILSYEFKADLDAYLAARGGPMKSLADLIAFNERERDREMPWFGQELFLASQARGPLTEDVYVQALARAKRLTQAEGIDKVAAQHRLDAFIAPTGGPAVTTDLLNNLRGGGFGCSTYAAVAGYPHLTVPMGAVHGMPLNLSFFGPAWTEGTLLGLGYAFEQATQARQAPTYRPTVGL